MAGYEGTVIVKITIGVSGRVASVDIAKSAGKAFDEAAKKVASRMKFSPAMKGGDPVAVKLPQKIVFKLTD